MIKRVAAASLVAAATVGVFGLAITIKLVGMSLDCYRLIQQKRRGKNEDDKGTAAADVARWRDEL